MNRITHNLKYPFITAFVGVSLITSFLLSRPDGKLHLVFCNVGQGDAEYLRTPHGSDILIDGGPDASVLNCLGKNMPFYDRSIDIVVLSHGHKDHFGGLPEVLKRYQVDYLIINGVEGEGAEYQALLKTARENQVNIKIFKAGQNLSLDNVKMDFLWPTGEWLAQNIEVDLTSQNSISNQASQVLGLAITKRDLNDFSFLVRLSYGNFKTLLTGDADSRVQDEILAGKIDLSTIQLVKVPHHGSKYAFLDEFLSIVKPKGAIISVGKNPWGHPAAETLNQLKQQGINTKITKETGNIKIISDGNKWEYQ